MKSKESCPVRPILPAYKAGLYGLTENRQLSNSNLKPPFIPVHRTGHSGCFSKILSFVLVLILFSLLPSLTLAQVQTRVRVIQASNVGSTIDPSIRDIHGQLGSLFSFSSYRLLRDDILNLSPNQPASVLVHQGRSIEITQIGLHKNVAELRIRMRSDGSDILNTQVRLSPGRTVIIGGPKHGEGVAILALSARF